MSTLNTPDGAAEVAQMPYVDIVSTTEHITRFLTRRDGSLPSEDLPDLLAQAAAGTSTSLEDEAHRYEFNAADGRINLRVWRIEPEVRLTPEPEPQVDDGDFEPM